MCIRDRDDANFVATYTGERTLSLGDDSLDYDLDMEISKLGNVVLVQILQAGSDAEPEEFFFRYDSASGPDEEEFQCAVRTLTQGKECVAAFDPFASALTPLPWQLGPPGQLELRDEYHVDQRGEMIAGLSAECFKVVLDPEAQTEYCFSEEGVFLGGSQVFGGAFIRFRAEAISDDVGPSDVEVPYPIID
jgi:hypothetical protein